MQILSDEELHRIVARTVQQVLGSAKPTPTSTVQRPPQVAVTPISIVPEKIEKKIVAIGTDHGGVDLKKRLRRIWLN